MVRWKKCIERRIRRWFQQRELVSVPPAPGWNSSSYSEQHSTSLIGRDARDPFSTNRAVSLQRAVGDVTANGANSMHGSSLMNVSDARKLCLRPVSVNMRSGSMLYGGCF